MLLTGTHLTDSLIDELLQERSGYVMDGGGTLLPLTALRLANLEPDSVRAFVERLDALARVLAYEDRILRALRALAQGGDAP